MSVGVTHDVPGLSEIGSGSGSGSVSVWFMNKDGIVRRGKMEPGRSFSKWLMMNSQ
jgi:hypothetical protein